MTKDDIFRMAREAGLPAGYRGAITIFDAEIELFAELITATAKAEEREECAKVCDEIAEFPSLTPRHCAESIRARKEQP